MSAPSHVATVAEEDGPVSSAGPPGTRRTCTSMCRQDPHTGAYIMPVPLRWCAYITPVLPQVVIFVKSVHRCIALAQLLVEQNFPAIAIHRGMPQEERWVGGECVWVWGCVWVCPSESCPVERRKPHPSHLLSHKGSLSISSSRIFRGGFLWLPTCLAEAWTLSM